MIDAIFIPGKGIDIGAGINETLKTKIFGGVVGIILDGRGRRPFNIPIDQEKRVSKLIDWTKETQEFPSIKVN